MSADRLAEIKARAEDATPEDVPWLVEEVERLEAWKFEAIEVMSGLRELGKALGLGLGVQITGPAALAEVERLTAERDALAARLALVEALAAAHDPARARYADGDPAGCYCTCSDDAREGCEHDPDEHQPTDQEADQ